MSKHEKIPEQTKSERTESAKADLKQTCFVLTPFAAAYKAMRRSAIDPAIESVGLSPVYANSPQLSIQIMSDIWQHIQESPVLVAVLTANNPNVFYELGLAHAIRKPVVLIADKQVKLPFDVRGLRVQFYNRDDPAWGETLREGLAAFLKSSLDDPAWAVPVPFCNIVQAETPDIERQDAFNRQVLERLATLEAQPVLLAPSNQHYSIKFGDPDLSSIIGHPESAFVGADPAPGIPVAFGQPITSPLELNPFPTLTLSDEDNVTIKK